MSGKILIEVRAKEYVDFSYSSLKTIKEELEGYIEKYGEDATMQLEQDDYSTSYSLYLYHRRLETDAEHDARLKREEMSKKWREERDQREFERLQKLYGSK